MSGFIRVKQLPTRYEVRDRNCDVLVRMSFLREELGTPLREDKVVVVRRHQVKRTEVVEEHYEHFTCWSSPRVVIEVILRRDGWILSPRTDGDDGMHIRREEAEAAARKWLRDNGYRVRKATIKQEAGR